jgi:predicted O-methyltransferase YrrM
MDFLPSKIEEYVLAHTKSETEILKALNRETNAKVLMPRMLAGHLQGAMIKMFSHMIKPKYVLEIGTYTGYSAICWADGLKEGGMVHTIDINEELQEMILKYFKKSGMENKMKLHIGNALKIIPQLNFEFDVVYIDADKENYSNYYDLVFDKVKIGGFIIADNVLWSGKVVEAISPNDKDTKAILEYNQKVLNDSRVENVLLPVRDGLMIARKI